RLSSEPDFRNRPDADGVVNRLTLWRKIDYLREGATVEGVKDAYEQQMKDVIDTRFDADARVLRGEAGTRITQALAEMPERRLQAFRLRDELEMSDEEVGQAMGVSAETVRSHVQRARTDLKRAAYDEAPVDSRRPGREN